MKKAEDINLGTNIALIRRDVDYIRGEISCINEKLEKNYVSIERFKPVETIAYTVTGTMGLAVIGAIASLIFK